MPLRVPAPQPTAAKEVTLDEPDITVNTGLTATEDTPLVDEAKYGVPDSGWLCSPLCGTTQLCRDLRWGSDASHMMVYQSSIGMLAYIGLISECKWHEWFEMWYCKYNPFWWIGWGCFMAMVLPGKWFHAMVGQGTKIKESESTLEYNCRVQWIYCCDGPYFCTMLLDIYQLIMAVINGSLGWNGSLMYAYSCTIYIAYLGGNIFFLHALNLQNQGRVRAGVVGNWAFVILLLGLIGYTRLSHHTCAKLNSAGVCVDSNISLVSSASRFIFVIYLAIAGFTYCQLWDIYLPPNEAPEKKSFCRVLGDLLHMGDQDQVEAVVGGADADGDHRTSHEEYVKLHGTDEGGMLRQSFEELDHDGDGFIDEAEVKAKQKFSCLGLFRGLWPLMLFYSATIFLAWYKPSLLTEALS